MPKRLPDFLERDADLQGATLRLFLRRARQCLRAHRPGSGPAARLGAVAFIHRFGSALNAHLHFHSGASSSTACSTPPPRGGAIFRAATGLELLDRLAARVPPIGMRSPVVRTSAPVSPGCPPPSG